MSHSLPNLSSWDVPAGRRWPAWFFSLVLHGTIVFSAALLIDQVPRGASTRGDRHVGVALVRQEQGERRYETAEQIERAQQAAGTSPSSTASSSAARSSDASNPGVGASVVPSDAVKSIDLEGVLPDLTTGGPLATPSLEIPNISGTVAGRGNDDRLSKAVHTSIFGATGTGNKFIYVFDRSGSMAAWGGRPLAAAKRELLASLHDLTETSQFQIFFYNEQTSVFQLIPGQMRMVWANAQGIGAAERFVRSIAADGGTRHLEPLRMALGLQPDVVFFLTDADEPRLTDRELRKVRGWNAGSVIHAIEFGAGPKRRADNFLAQLARENGGKHIYVDVTGLDE